jgi:hypothetical protein
MFLLRDRLPPPSRMSRSDTLVKDFSVLLSYEAGAVPFTPQLVGSILVESILLIVKPLIKQPSPLAVQVITLDYPDLIST